MRLPTVRSSLLVLLASMFVGFVFGGFVTGCTVGEAPGSDDSGTTYVDDDGDGVTDAVDTDGDGESDFTIEECSFCEPHARVICRAPLIDENGDGLPDGIDRDCDGRIDVRFGASGRPPAGGNGGAGEGQNSRCIANATVNGTKFGVTCNIVNGVAACECRKNDVLITSCTQATTTCSLQAINGKVKAGCCQF